MNTSRVKKKYGITRVDSFEAPSFIGGKLVYRNIPIVRIGQLFWVEFSMEPSGSFDALLGYYGFVFRRRKRRFGMVYQVQCRDGFNSALRLYHLIPDGRGTKG